MAFEDMRAYLQELQDIDQLREIDVPINCERGKNELQAQIQALLLILHSFEGGEIVIVSPTFKPQTENAMRRLRRVLEKNGMTSEKWKKESGYVYRVGQCLVSFFSGQREANVVGATASLLLMVDEAQDTSPVQWDVIEKLAQEFTSGVGARGEVERTIFVVGDKLTKVINDQGDEATLEETLMDLAESLGLPYREIELR